MKWKLEFNLIFVQVVPQGKTVNFWAFVLALAKTLSLLISSLSSQCLNVGQFDEINEIWGQIEPIVFHLPSHPYPEITSSYRPGYLIKLF